MRSSCGSVGKKNCRSKSQKLGWNRCFESFNRRRILGNRSHVRVPRHQKKQNYERYIQKKLSPGIFSRMLTNLSDEKLQWIKQTGFGKVLGMRMKRYAHKLGFALVEAFDQASCSLTVKKGSIKITDVVVEKVLGLPRGNHKVELEDSKTLLWDWEKQFGEKPFYKITASKVAEKIKSDSTASYMFKINFLVLLSNFLVESNNNGYVKTEVVGFRGNLENFSDYNWCALVIDKLVSTHEFWAGNPTTRYFTGSLPLLTVSKSNLFIMSQFYV